MNKHPSKGHMRFWVQNCYGIKPHDDANFNHVCTQLHEYGMHYFAFTETNVNTSNSHMVSKIHRTFKTRFSSGRMNITNSPHYPNRATFQPGGVLSGFTTWTMDLSYISREGTRHQHLQYVPGT